jgi:hypothetical protein
MIEVPRGKYIGERVGESSRATRASMSKISSEPSTISAPMKTRMESPGTFFALQKRRFGINKDHLCVPKSQIRTYW